MSPREAEAEQQEQGQYLQPEAIHGVVVAFVRGHSVNHRAAHHERERQERQQGDDDVHGTRAPEQLFHGVRPFLNRCRDRR